MQTVLDFASKVISKWSGDNRINFMIKDQDGVLNYCERETALKSTV